MNSSVVDCQEHAYRSHLRVNVCLREQHPLSMAFWKGEQISVLRWRYISWLTSGSKLLYKSRLFGPLGYCHLGVFWQHLGFGVCIETWTRLRTTIRGYNGQTADTGRAHHEIQVVEKHMHTHLHGHIQLWDDSRRRLWEICRIGNAEIHVGHRIEPGHIIGNAYMQAVGLRQYTLMTHTGDWLEHKYAGLWTKVGCIYAGRWTKSGST